MLLPFRKVVVIPCSISYSLFSTNSSKKSLLLLVRFIFTVPHPYFFWMFLISVTYFMRHVQNPDIFKTLFIQAYSSIFMHIQELFKQIQAYPGKFRNIQVYSEPWYIQNPGIFRNLAYSKPCQKSSMEPFTEIVNDYHYFRKL